MVTYKNVKGSRASTRFTSFTRHGVEREGRVLEGETK
jgi:hypothetical protein